MYIGNVLLQAALDICLAILFTGCSAFIEHPAEPSWHSVAATLPSIWKLPEIHDLFASPAVHKVNLLQRPYGQVSPKPTTLLVVRLPGFEEALPRAALLVQELPPLIDIMARDADGGWNTAGLLRCLGCVHHV